MSQPPLFEQIEQLKAADARDKLFDEAASIAQEHGTVSINLLQRRLRIGYGRAARLVDQLREAGVINSERGGAQERTSPDEPSSPPPPPARIIGGTGEGENEGGDQTNPPSRFWM
jgi:DNA segregation ATPase FtsK/SpoIIIE, S-DNA-T family